MMMNTKIIKSSLLTFLILSACRNSEPKLPIPKEKLIYVLMDIHLAEAAYDSEQETMRDSLARIYYPQIFEKHAVTRSDFDSTMAILGYNPDMMDKIYGQVIDSIRVKTDSLTSSANKNKAQ